VIAAAPAFSSTRVLGSYVQVHSKLMSIFLTKLLIVVALSLFIVGLAGCSSEGANPTHLPTATPTPTLTIYSGRSEELVSPIIKEFSKLTGIKVAVRWGGSSELAATIMEEGENTPSDIFYSQDPGALGAVSAQLMTLPDATLNKVKPEFRSTNGSWVGVSGRARSVAFSTKRVAESELPDSIWGFTDQKWKGRLAWAPTNGSFQVMVTGMRKLWGDQKTKEWLMGIHANKPTVHKNNSTQIKSIGDGEVDIGFVNHYYLLRFLDESVDGFPVRNYHPKAGDPGSLIMVSGIGILKNSKQSEAAIKFVDFLLSSVGQQYFTSKTFEYPVAENIKISTALVPLSKFQQPNIDLADLADLKGTLKLIQNAGVL